MTNIQKFIAAAREIEGKATPGPWLESNIVYATGEIDSRQIAACEDGPIICTVDDDTDAPEGNQQFIAFARNNLPRLLDALEKQAAALEFYADAFKIMDHIDGTYTIHDTWYVKARTCQAEVEKLLGGGE